MVRLLSKHGGGIFMISSNNTRGQTLQAEAEVVGGVGCPVLAPQQRLLPTMARCGLLLSRAAKTNL